MQGKQEVEVQLYVLCGQVHAINGEETVTTLIFTQGKVHKLHLFSPPPHPVPGLNLGRCMIPDKPSASELDSQPPLLVFILKQGLTKLLRLVLNFLCSTGWHRISDPPASTSQGSEIINLHNQT